MEALRGWFSPARKFDGKVSSARRKQTFQSGENGPFRIKRRVGIESDPCLFESNTFGLRLTWLASTSGFKQPVIVIGSNLVTCKSPRRIVLTFSRTENFRMKLFMCLKQRGVLVARQCARYFVICLGISMLFCDFV